MHTLYTEDSRNRVAGCRILYNIIHMDGDGIETERVYNTYGWGWDRNGEGIQYIWMGIG